MLNTYAASCFACGDHVEPGQGELRRAGAGWQWQVHCRSCRAPRLTCTACGLAKLSHLVGEDGVCVDCA